MKFPPGNFVALMPAGMGDKGMTKAQKKAGADCPGLPPAPVSHVSLRTLGFRFSVLFIMGRAKRKGEQKAGKPMVSLLFCADF